MLKVVVTGGGGFIGSHLVPALMDAGYEVTYTVEPSALDPIPGGRIIRVDISDSDNLAGACAGADVVVHLAARNHVLRETVKDPLIEYRRVNVQGTRNVIRAANVAGVSLFVHMSSVKAMGEVSNSILDENSPCAPGTPYGISKLESEGVAYAESAGSGMSAIVLRLPMVYGPGNKGNLPRMIRWADRGLPFPLLQPDNLRSMVYVGNVVAAVKAVLEAHPDAHPMGDAAPKTYIVKDDADCSTRMIFSSICRGLGKVPRFLPLPTVLGRFAGVISEDFRKVTSSFRVSSAKIREEIGFVSPVSGEEGIARTVRWYKCSVQ